MHAHGLSGAGVALNLRVAVAGLSLVLAVAFSKPTGSDPVALEAHRVTAASAAADLFGGSDAVGGIGDWRLSNGVVEVIVDDVGVQLDLLAAGGGIQAIQNGVNRSGGVIVDLGLVGHDNDQFVAMNQFLNFDERFTVTYVPASFALGDPGLPSVLAEEGPAEASLTVHGLVAPGAPGPPLQVTTRYSVRPGEPFVHIRTEVTNPGPVAANVRAIVDAFVQAGGGGTLPFTPFPSAGFHLGESIALSPSHSFVGRLGPSDGTADSDGSGPVGEVSYTMASAAHPILVVSQTLQYSAAGRPPDPTPLAVGEGLVYERELWVGARNDVSSSADGALTGFLDGLAIPHGTLRGRLVSSDGNAFRASLEVWQLDLLPATPDPETLVSAMIGDGSPLPIGHVITDSARDGEFELVVPAGSSELRMAVESREDLPSIPFTMPPGGVVDLGDIGLSSTGSVDVSVSDLASGLPLPARVRVVGWAGTPDPSLGMPILRIHEGELFEHNYWGSLPFEQGTYTDVAGLARLQLPPGRYRILAAHGPEWTIEWGEVDVVEGGIHALALDLERVVDTTGWIAADFHVHAAASADSAVPPGDRVRSLAGEGVEVMVSSDHDLVFDYAPIIQELGFAARIASIVGVEVTTSAGNEVVAAPLPAVHVNGWPIPFQPDARKNGAPEDHHASPATSYDRLRGLGAEVVQLNHPTWSNHGYLDDIGFDPALPVDAPPNDTLLETSALATGTRNLDFDVIEVQNGIDQLSNPGARTAWMSLLSQGLRKTGTAASDTHKIDRAAPGFPRTWVAFDGDVSDFDATSFNGSLLAMKAVGSAGPFVQLEARDGPAAVGMGETLSAPSLDLWVQVQAPCWMPVDQVSVWANGERLIQMAADPVCTSSTRFEQIFPLTPSVDTYYLVTVEQSAVRPMPSNFDEALYFLAYPTISFDAFTNPIFVDVDGNGVFDPPGVGPVTP